MCWVQLAELLQLSVAVQMRSTPAWPVQLAVAVSLEVIVGAPPQLSVALAVPLLAILLDWPHCSCASAGQLIAGAVVSATVTVFMQVFEQSLLAVMRVRVKLVLQLLRALTL